MTLIVFAIAPSLVSAATITIKKNVWDPTILAGPLTVCTGNYITAASSTAWAAKSGTLPPCQNLCDLVAQIITILYYVMAVGIWIIIPIMFAYGGIKFMLSRGDPAKTSEARKMLTGVVVGVVIMISAYLIVSIFIGFFNLTNVIGGFGSATCHL